MEAEGRIREQEIPSSRRDRRHHVNGSPDGAVLASRDPRGILGWSKMLRVARNGYQALELRAGH
ncbi:hypothetical protein CFAM422_004735 [Trichoderma lentiforme]|uniref:Uncharacterized protein n=1 Tax=Trichoderma lentiforme TaxID=1567552 RepID=A0A9P4XJX2_9HYPO|nr:hypothetical protein CFAM422_004735 [Trichoderma lentiforme]